MKRYHDMNTAWMRGIGRWVTLALTATLLMLPAQAAFTDEAEFTYPKAIQTLVELQVISGKGDGSSFAPTDTITRAEMAKMICHFRSRIVLPVPDGTSLPGFTQEPPSDVGGHWALPYIQLCIMNEIMVGQGNNLFAPEAQVTGLETAKMLMGLAGYLPSNEGFLGTEWAQAVETKATELGLFEGFADFDPTDPLTREEAAQMMYQSLGLTIVRYDYLLGTVDGQLVTQVVVKPMEPAHDILSLYHNFRMEDGTLVPLT